MRFVVAAAVFVAACGSPPSKLDTISGSAAAGGDPWAVTAAGTKEVDVKDSGGGGGALGGIDLKGVFEKIKDGIKKPSPYEAPEHSPGFDDKKPHTAILELGGPIVEKTAFSLRGGKGTELAEIVARFRGLAKDPNVTGLVVRFDNVEISVPDLVELRIAMHDFRAAKKPLACHAEGAGEATYQLMAACDRIGLAPLGEVTITGPAAMPVHVKPLLDKFGVVADFLHVGAYKGAAEPLTRDAPSKEMEEVLGTILDRRYATLVDIIAQDRKIDPATVKTLVDTGLFPSDDAKAAKLVDDVGSFEAFRDAAVGGAGGAWTMIKLKAERSDFENLALAMRFIGMTPLDRPTSPHVAVIYAIGDIVDGDGDGVLGARQQIASHTLVATLRALTDDASVKAVVLRIDSGGGSAQASELIWRAVADLKAKKPVVVSMSDVAASGGYYIASGATKIFALPDTLTGSIGVVGGKLALGPALEKLGVNTFPIGRGKHATMMAAMRPWSEDEKATIQNTMQAVYKVFVGRVADGRKKQVADIEAIAQGRVWTGSDALAKGLVDELGGLDAALAEAKKLGAVDDATPLEVYPNSPTLRDILAGYGLVHAPMGVDAAIDEVRAMSPEVGDAVASLVAIALSFRATQIQTVAIIPVVK